MQVFPGGHPLSAHVKKVCNVGQNINPKLFDLPSWFTVWASSWSWRCLGTPLSCFQAEGGEPYFRSPSASPQMPHEVLITQAVCPLITAGSQVLSMPLYQLWVEHVLLACSQISCPRPNLMFMHSIPNVKIDPGPTTKGNFHQKPLYWPGLDRRPTRNNCKWQEVWIVTLKHKSVFSTSLSLARSTMSKTLIHQFKFLMVQSQLIKLVIGHSFKRMENMVTKGSRRNINTSKAFI